MNYYFFRNIWRFLKPVFHWMLRLRLVPNATKKKRDKQHEIYMPNPNPALAYYIHMARVRGLALGVTQILVFALGVPQILAFLDTNMLVSAMQNCGVGGLSQREWFRIAVEYWLKVLHENMSSNSKLSFRYS